MKIEELINSRKEHLDFEEVPSTVWDKVSKEWRKPKNSSSYIWKIAAALLFVAVVGLLVRNHQLESKVGTLANLGDISAEYAAIQASYESEIKSIESTIPIQVIRQQEDFQWILDELKLLDEVNDLYRADIGIVNSNQLIPTLLDYYEKKIKLLQRLQLEIKRQNNHENNKTTTTAGAAA